MCFSEKQKLSLATCINLPSFLQYEDDDDAEDEDGDGGMAEAAEESNEGSGSADANEAYEGDEAEVTPTFTFKLLYCCLLVDDLNLLQ